MRIDKFVKLRLNMDTEEKVAILGNLKNTEFEGDTENGRRGRRGRRGRQGRSYLFQYIGSFAQLNLLLFLKYFFTF